MPKDDDVVDRLQHIAVDIETACAEIERLRLLIAPAKALVKEIREQGMHQNWKRLANTLSELGFD